MRTTLSAETLDKALTVWGNLIQPVEDLQTHFSLELRQLPRPGDVRLGFHNHTGQSLTINTLFLHIPCGCCFPGRPWPGKALRGLHTVASLEQIWLSREAPVSSELEAPTEGCACAQQGTQTASGWDTSLRQPETGKPDS